MKLFVGNLPPRLTDSDLRAAFSVYGEVATARIVFDQDSGRSRGFGFVDMPSGSDAEKAVEGMHDAEFDGVRLTVSPKQESLRSTHQMSTRLEFFYDYVSSYSYLANHRVRGMRDVEVTYRPMFLGAVMKATGNSPPGTIPAKGRYLAKDLARWADSYGIPFRFNSIFPQNTLMALRLAVVAQQWGTFFELHQQLFDSMFVHDRDLSDAGVLAGILADSGLNADDYLAAAEDDEVKETLKRNTEEAVQRGAFGAPTFFVGDEMFFGNDRFDFLRKALERQE